MRFNYYRIKITLVGLNNDNIKQQMVVIMFRSLEQEQCNAIKISCCIYTVSFKDLDQSSKMIIFGSRLTTFESSFIF